MVTYEELVSNRQTALLEIDAGTSTINALARELQEGISLADSVKLVNLMWNERDARILKADLFAAFPKRNAETILSRGLDAKVSNSFVLTATRQFFADSSAFIEANAIERLNSFSRCKLDDEDALEDYIKLRKNLVRYIAFLDWGIYDIRTKLLNRDIDCWCDINESVMAIESGDYMIWDNFPELLAEAHKTYAINHLNRMAEVNMRSIEWNFEGIQAFMELRLIFAKYLNPEVKD